MLSPDIVIVGGGKQAPVRAVNALTLLNDKSSTVACDGYGSCLLIATKEKTILAEAGYRSALHPSFPMRLIEETEPSRFGWIFKKDLLPQISWDAGG